MGCFMSEVKSSNDRFVLLRNRYDYCRDCMLGEYSECEYLVDLDGCFFCECHGKWLKSVLRVYI